MTPAQLTRLLQEFLAEARSAVIFENGEEVFAFTEDARSARYSISGDHGKCLLHLWSPERNFVRRITEAEVKKDSLLLQGQRFGQTKPVKLEIFRERDRRSPSVRKTSRSAYTHLLERVLKRHFPELKASKLSISSNLEHSFSPAYGRGLLHRGRSSFAVLGINDQESQSSIDAALTFGLLWLHYLRQREIRALVEGLKLIVPQGTSAVLRERIACLDQSAAKFELYELDEREQSLELMDCSDRGNIATKLVRAVDQPAARERFAASVEHVLALVPDAQRVALSASSPAELSFRLHGLEFARARWEAGAQQITFGAGAHETALTAESEPLFRELAAYLFAARRADGERRDALFRMQPERWLESLVIENVCALDSEIDSQHVYSQVPAFSSSDRAMIDVLAAKHDGRLCVIELKADEDIHLPLQGLDYWARVEWHHSRGEFQRCGYFAQRQLSPAAPLLLLVAPALHVHPATDILLSYLSPEIDWTFIGIDERWREGARVVFRKRREKRQLAATT